MAVELIETGDGQVDMVVVQVVAKEGVTVPEDFIYELKHGGSLYKLKPNQAVTVPKFKAQFFLAKSRQNDPRNPCIVKMMTLAEAQASKVEVAQTAEEIAKAKAMEAERLAAVEAAKKEREELVAKVEKETRERVEAEMRAKIEAEVKEKMAGDAAAKKKADEDAARKRLEEETKKAAAGGNKPA